MIIKDIFLLERSEEFTLISREEVTVNLSLHKSHDNPKTILKGIVLDSCCNPISGATIKVFTLDYVPIEHTTADCNGKFYFIRVLPPNKYYVVATAEGYTVSNSYEINITHHCHINLMIKLYKNILLSSGTIYGIVTDDNRSHLSNASVIVSKRCINKTIATTETNSDGEYLIHGLPPGNYTIRPIKKGYTYIENTSFTMKFNEMLKVNLKLQEDIPYVKGIIRGKIISKGVALPNTIVSLYVLVCNTTKLVKNEKTNSDGQYVFVDIYPGRYLFKCNNVSWSVIIK